MRAMTQAKLDVAYASVYITNIIRQCAREGFKLLRRGLHVAKCSPRHWNTHQIDQCANRLKDLDKGPSVGCQPYVNGTRRDRHDDEDDVTP